MRACEDCSYWNAAEGGQEGECRLHPPTIVVLPVQTLQGNTIQPVPILPRTQRDFWCGDFKTLR